MSAKNGDWWTGTIGDKTGVFPFNYVEPAPQVSLTYNLIFWENACFVSNIIIMSFHGSI